MDLGRTGEWGIFSAFSYACGLSGLFLISHPFPFLLRYLEFHHLEGFCESPVFLLPFIERVIVIVVYRHYGWTGSDNPGLVRLGSLHPTYSTSSRLISIYSLAKWRCEYLPLKGTEGEEGNLRWMQSTQRSARPGVPGGAAPPAITVGLMALPWRGPWPSKCPLEDPRAVSQLVVTILFWFSSFLVSGVRICLEIFVSL